MLKHYLKTAWRGVKRSKFFSLINIFGLALGMCACLLILQYVRYQFSFEDFQVNGNRIYRVQQDRYNNGKISTQWAAGAFAVGNHFKDDIPQIEAYVKLIDADNAVAYKDLQPIQIKQAFYASKDFFHIFTFPLLAGNGKEALVQPNSVAIAASTARQLFGTTNVLGKTLELNQNSKYLITAVYKDPPLNTQLRPDILISYPTLVAKMTRNGDNPEDAWNWDGCLTYLLLQKGTDPATVETQFKPLMQKYQDQDKNIGPDRVVYHLQPLRDIHLQSHYLHEPGPVQKAQTVYLLFGIAIFIIIIAWVNYINLSTARAVTRAKEIGIRKAIGSFRQQLIGQFLLEAALLNFFALMLSVLLMAATLPVFNQLTGLQLNISLFGTPLFWLGFIALFVTGTLASGIYPAFVLSGFNPVKVLKDHNTGTSQNQLLRKSLVTFQFITSLFLLISTLVVFQQIRFMQRQSLGVSLSQTLVLQQPEVGLDSSFPSRLIAFKNALLQEPAIKDLTVSTSIPGEHIMGNAGGIRRIGTDLKTSNQYRFFFTDYNFMSYYKMKIIAGRAFSSNYPADIKNNAVVLTKKAAELLGFTDPKMAINQHIDFWGDTCAIVGVVADYHQESLQQGYDQIIMRLAPNNDGNISIKLATRNADRVIDKARQAWNRFMPGNTFDYFFLDDHFNQQYKSDNQFMKIFMIFTCLAVIIACLGLLGLASFSTLQRKKEIGIRKLLGASITSILGLLYKETLLLLLIAFIITLPLAWLAMTHWLHNYAFQVPISWVYFLLPFIGICLIAVLATGYQTLRAARQNPVKSLQSE